MRHSANQNPKAEWPATPAGTLSAPGIKNPSSLFIPCVLFVLSVLSGPIFLGERFQTGSSPRIQDAPQTHLLYDFVIPAKSSQPPLHQQFTTKMTLNQVSDLRQSRRLGIAGAAQSRCPPDYHSSVLLQYDVLSCRWSHPLAF